MKSNIPINFRVFTPFPIIIYLQVTIISVPITYFLVSEKLVAIEIGKYTETKAGRKKGFNGFNRRRAVLEVCRYDLHNLLQHMRQSCEELSQRTPQNRSYQSRESPFRGLQMGRWQTSET